MAATATPPVLTDRQQQLVDFLKTSIERDGYVPSVREMGAEMGITSPNGVMAHLKALEKKGAIRRKPNLARAIKVLV